MKKSTSEQREPSRSKESSESQGEKAVEATLSLENWDQMMSSLKNSVNRFESEQSPESLAAVVTALSHFGFSGADLWKRFANYAKSRPLQVALYSAVMFFALRGLIGSHSSKTAATSGPELH